MNERIRAESEIRARIKKLNEQISDNQDWIEFGVYKEWQHRMARAQIEAAKFEKEKLEEILDDL